MEGSVGTVKRYGFKDAKDYIMLDTPIADGPYVLHSDYAALESELAALREKLDSAERRRDKLLIDFGLANAELTAMEKRATVAEQKNDELLTEINQLYSQLSQPEGGKL
jgi:septal ring factor EnvC (AmiA/AmiB activator)